MASENLKTFWDIEKEKTWRIYGLFGFLLALHFISVFIIWIFAKFFICLRMSLRGSDVSFEVFGAGTWFVLIIAVIATVIHWYYSNTRAISKILRLLGAKRPDKYDRYHSVFQNVVDEIEISAGGLKVERYILPTGAMNAFALSQMRAAHDTQILQLCVSCGNRQMSGLQSDMV